MDNQPKEEYDWLTRMVIDTERLENPEIGPPKASKRSKRVYAWIVFSPSIVLLLTVAILGIIEVKQCGFDRHPSVECEFYTDGTHIIGGLAFMFLIPSLLFGCVMLLLAKLTDKE